MSEEIQQKYMDFGALGYKKDRIALILGLTKSDLEKQWKDYERYYKQGSSEFDFQIDRKLMGLAMGGDMKAMDKLERKKRGN